MLKNIPYQPLLLRILHSLNGLLVVSALISGFLVYDSYDGRFGSLGLTKESYILIDIHGTFAFILFFIVLPLFIVYCLIKGTKKLLKPRQIKSLTKQINQPIWWYNLHRLVNTLILISLSFAVITGKFQSEGWLPKQELNHFAYYAHLLAWLLLLISVLIHGLMVVKVGGVPLIISMYNFKYKPQDSSRLWWGNIKVWLKNLRN
jgi:magnesium-transporting ATPase (P-type)